MNSAAIRAATRVPEYSVLCDCCHGKMFHDGLLCAKCDGEGRVLILDRHVSPHMSERGKYLVVVATAICFVAAAVAIVLM